MATSEGGVCITLVEDPKAEEFKRLAAQLEENPKRREAFNLGVDSLTRYFE